MDLRTMFFCNWRKFVLFLSLTCTWDITKAFDSVSKNVMKLAWTRLGVPEDWVQWLVGMDENGTTTVRTPHSIGIWNNQGAAGLTRRSRKQRPCRVYDRFLCPGTVHQQESEREKEQSYPNYKKHDP